MWEILIAPNLTYLQPNRKSFITGCHDWFLSRCENFQFNKSKDLNAYSLRGVSKIQLLQVTNLREIVNYQVRIDEEKENCAKTRINRRQRCCSGDGERDVSITYSK